MVRARYLALTFAFYTCAAVVMTLPLAQHPTRVLPSDLIDTLLNTWIIGWDAERLRHGLIGVWNAPIFFPYDNSLAFSENLFGLSFFVAPIYWVANNAILTYNVAFVGSFALAGFGMYLLAYSLTGNRPAAILAGTSYAFCPYRIAQIVHIQMVATGWIPVALYGLHQYFQSRRRRWLALFSAAYVLQVTSNMYVAYAMAIPSAFVIADSWGAHRTQWRPIARDLSLAVLAVLVALAPIVIPYYRARVDYRNVRNSVEIEMGSADVRAYVSPIDSVGLWRSLPSAVPLDAEKALFPGILIVGLAGIAAIHALRRRGALRRWVILYGAIGAAAALISFGPHVHAWGVKLTDHGPYDWLWRIVPGWDGMRVPARFGIIVCLSLSVVGGIGASVALGRLSHRAQALAAVCGVVFILAEGWSVPMRTVAYSPRGRPEDRDVSQWLADRPAGAVLDMPMVTDNFEELNYQYATLLHHHPLVNGMSGYNSGLQRLFRNPEGPLYDWERPAAVVQMLRAIGIRYVVVHHGDYTRAERSAGEEEKTIDLLRRSNQVAFDRQLYGARVFELESTTERPGPVTGVPIDSHTFSVKVQGNDERATALVDGDRDTRWFAEQNGQSFIEAQFAEPTDVAAAELMWAERSLTDYPRQLLIEAYDGRGSAQTLYAGSPYSEFVLAFVRDGFYPRMTIRLPENHAVRLRIQQTAMLQGRRWWSVHELRLWKR